MQGFNRWVREVIPPIALILGIVLAVTIIFLVVSGASARIGTLRPLNTIPEKGVEIFLTGAAVGLTACAAAKRLDLSILALGIAFVAIIAVDHLPSAFGIPQPIRPAHTFAFLAVEVVALGLVFRKRPELVLLAAAAWFGHVAADQGVFAFFAPLSFAYSPLGPYRIPFALISVVFALATGYVVAHRQRRSGMS